MSKYRRMEDMTGQAKRIWKHVFPGAALAFARDGER
jgi:hypothetical protein